MACPAHYRVSHRERRLCASESRSYGGLVYALEGVHLPGEAVFHLVQNVLVVGALTVMEFRWRG
jgi:hypothetical protein